MRPTGPPAGAAATAGPSFLAAFESTYLPGHGVDVAETTGHARRWAQDLDAVVASGVRRLRYPLRWHRIEPSPGVFDFSHADEVLDHLRARGLDPVLDLLHHTSYPEWLDDGFRDRRFGAAYLRYAVAVAERYPWLRAYTLLNEPFATLFLAGHEALWPPYDHGVEGFVRLLRTVLPPMSEAAAAWRELLPHAQHVWVDTCEHHQGTAGPPARHAETADDRRHVVLDLALGRHLDPDRPFLARLLAAGGEDLMDLRPQQVDVLGLDYYSHSEWWYDEQGGHAPSPYPLGFAAVAGQYGRRYGLPLVLAETNVRGRPSDRVTWLRYMLDQYREAVAAGVPLEGFCWFPTVDSCDWDSLLARPGGRPDPVGVLGLGPDGERVRTCFTTAWEAAVAGAGPEDLPAYRFQPPCDRELAGFVAGLDRWPWQDPPVEDGSGTVHVPSASLLPGLPGPAQEHHHQPHEPHGQRCTMTTSPPAATTEPAGPDLVVLSHLRWPWVWQRPQHLVSRFARARTAGGARTWFVEEPVHADVAVPTVATEEVDGLTRVWLCVPGEPAARIEDEVHLGFDAPEAAGYGRLLVELLTGAGRQRVDVLLYTPMALDVAEALTPDRLFYDVMDDLASFAEAPAGMVLRQRRALAEADVVFAGGRSLHRSVAPLCSGPCHLFASGVETSHYARSQELRRPRDRRVAGYVGVVDERLDLDLLAGLAERLPGWTVRVVGPVAKIDRADLPQAPNLEYPGMVAYQRLPEVMAGFDVALMPFALNEATRSISPTKTLEYLAAGLPVVSTRVPDVVAGYDGLVHLVDDAEQMAAACRTVVDDPPSSRATRLRAVARTHEWDVIAETMDGLMRSAGDRTALSGAPA